jgi:hypothetical protein
MIKAVKLLQASLERQLDRMNSTTSQVWSTSCTLEVAQFPFDLVLPCPIFGFRSEVTSVISICACDQSEVVL